MAEPVDFPEANTTFDSNGAENVVDLPCFVDETTTVSCWKLSEEERKLVAETGYVWLGQLNYGRPLQAQAVWFKNPFFAAGGERGGHQVTFMPPISWLRERFYLCEEGVLRHNKTVGKLKKGDPVGWLHKSGYWYLSVVHEGKRKKLALHRVVWSMKAGRAVPDHLEVDHRDKNPDHNKPWNSRAVAVRVNQLNKKKPGTGVSQCGTRFRSRIKVHGIDIDLGTHDTWKAANKEYRRALKGQHPKCTRDVLRGRPYTQILVEEVTAHAN